MPHQPDPHHSNGCTKSVSCQCENEGRNESGNVGENASGNEDENEGMIENRPQIKTKSLI